MGAIVCKCARIAAISSAANKDGVPPPSHQDVARPDEEKVKIDVEAQTETVWLIDWKNPEKNRFAIAEEVTVKPADPKAHGKRPDIVLYVNGIALGWGF